MTLNCSKVSLFLGSPVGPDYFKTIWHFEYVLFDSNSETKLFNS